MIKLTRQFSFSANDFFDYLDQQLITSIKKARSNNLPVILKTGTSYQIEDTKVKITQYQRGKVYASHFKNNRMDIVIKYLTEDSKDGVKITFSEDMLSFDREKHGKLQTLFYNLQLKAGARRELKRMADNVYANLAS